MAFYDNLREKITKTGQGAVQKTRNIADITKLNMANSEIEKSNREIFQNLGRLCYEKYPDAIEDPDYQNYVNQLNANQEQIQANNRQIFAMKGVQACPTCGAEVPKGISFCGKCGTKVPDWVEPETESPAAAEAQEDRPVATGAKCPTCKVMLLDGTCPVCGWKADPQ